MLQQLQHVVRNCRGLTILVPARKFVSWYTRAFKRGMSLSTSCLLPSFRTSPPGSESYCPSCPVHTQGQESSRWAQGLAGDRAGGSDLTLRCWWWFSASSKADQLNCIDLCQELQGAWGTELPEPVRVPLILEGSSPELLISISGSPERPLPKVARNKAMVTTWSPFRQNAHLNTGDGIK